MPNSDAGFQDGITSISTAAQQIKVFSRVLKTAISGFLSITDDRQKKIEDCAKMVCNGQHTYVYCQVLLHVLSKEPGGCIMKRLSQEITKCAQQQHDVTPIIMSLNGAADYPQVCQALSSMLTRNALNPADIIVLYRNYNTPDPPPIDLIRIPQFLELMVDALFRPGIKLHPEHMPKYVFILAYATSVVETIPTKMESGVKRTLNIDELNSTALAIDKVHNICSASKDSDDLIVELSAIYNCIKYPIVSIGIVRWVECTVTEPSYFTLNTADTPIHFALLDEVVTNHPLLHPTVLSLCIQLFESKQDELVIFRQLEMKKMILERMVNLFSCGCVVPVIEYIKQCWCRGDDIYLIRYFVSEVLDIIAPPYTSEFVQLFLPIVENVEITGNMRSDSDSDPVSEFIAHCKTNYTTV